MYCEINNKPTLFYKFGNAAEKSIRLGNSPIDILTGQTVPSATSNYNPEGFGIRYANYFRWVETTVRDYKIRQNPPGFFYPYHLEYLPCHTNIWSSEQYYPGSLTIQPERKCQTTAPNSKCFIEVKNLESISIFKAEGDCPLSYRVQCGNCPEGSFECKCGCCLSCGSIRSEIAAMSSILRRING